MAKKKRGPYRKRRPKPCILVECDRRHYAKGLCRSHWAHRQRTGDLDLKPQGPLWTKAEDEIILELPEYPTGRAKHKVVEEVATLLGRSSNAAAERRSRLKKIKPLCDRADDSTA